MKSNIQAKFGFLLFLGLTASIHAGLYTGKIRNGLILAGGATSTLFAGYGLYQLTFAQTEYEKNEYALDIIAAYATAAASAKQHNGQFINEVFSSVVYFLTLFNDQEQEELTNRITLLDGALLAQKDPEDKENGIMQTYQSLICYINECKDKIVAKRKKYELTVIGKCRAILRGVGKKIEAKI